MDQGSDGEALELLAQASAPGVQRDVVHYLYFASRSTASSVAADLSARGFATEYRLAGDDTSWLVLATHRIVPTPDAIDATRRLLDDVAESCDGEYDGWEARVVGS